MYASLIGETNRHTIPSIPEKTDWDGNNLVGLVRGIDDGCMTAFLHYLLVSPTHRHRGIASQLLERAKEHYKDFFYLNVMPEESCNASFHELHGFQVMPDGVAMQWNDPHVADQ